MKKKHKLSNIFIMTLIILVLACGAAAVYFYATSEDYKEQTMLKDAELTRNTKTVYVATRNISKGETLLEEGENANIQLQNIYTGLDYTSFITPEQIGSTIIVDLTYGEPVMTNMITTEELSNDTRWVEIACAELMTTQAEGDCIDLRIAFPDGEDFIVLAKKYLVNMQKANCIFNCKLNEEEILRLRSAIIDAYTIAGCKLYTTVYVEENLQPEATPTYPVNEANIELINSDPNVLTKAMYTLNMDARLSLEARVSSYEDEYLNSLTSSYEEEDVKKTTIWQQTETETTDEYYTAPDNSGEGKVGEE